MKRIVFITLVFSICAFSGLPQANEVLVDNFTGGVASDTNVTYEGNAVRLGIVDYINTSMGYETTIDAPPGVSAAVIATDGTYLYAKRLGSETGPDNKIWIIGSGFGDPPTTPGMSYGMLGEVSDSVSMTYFPDGYIYNGHTDAYGYIERINVSNGLITFVELDPSMRLLNRVGENCLGEEEDDILITSDGWHIYNLAQPATGPWKLRVFNRTGATPMDIEGPGPLPFSNDVIAFYADGENFYVMEDCRCPNAIVARYDLETGAQKDQYQTDQATLKLAAGQYDWVNNKVWLGNYEPAKGAGSLHQHLGMSYTTDGFFTSASIMAEPAPIWEQIAWSTNFTGIGATLQFQLATNNDDLTWDFYGPDGTGGTKYTCSSGEYVNTTHNGGRYIKFKAIFEIGDPGSSAVLNSVTIGYVLAGTPTITPTSTPAQTSTPTPGATLAAPAFSSGSSILLLLLISSLLAFSFRKVIRGS